MMYNGFYEDAKKLKSLLSESRLLVSGEAEVYNQDGKFVVEFEYKTSDDSYSKFRKEFDTVGNFKKFINDIELINNINSSGLGSIKLVQNESNEFEYSIDDEELKSHSLSYISMIVEARYSNLILNKLTKFSIDLGKVWLSVRRYNDTIDDNLSNMKKLRDAKFKATAAFQNKKIYSEKIYASNSGTVFWKTFYFDLDKVVKFVKENDSRSFDEYMSKFYDAILNGDEIEIKNYDLINSFYDYYTLNKILDIATKKIINIKEYVKTNSELAFNQEKKLLSLIDEINNTPLLKKQQKLIDLIIPEDEKFPPYIDKENSELITEKKVSEGYKKEVFKNLQLDQATLLTPDEKLALNLYKSQMYRAFNRVIRYQRETGVNNDENIQRYINSSWEELKKQNEEYFNSDEVRVARVRDSREQNDLTIGEIFLDKYPNGLPSKEEYKDLIINYLPYVLSALNKVTLTEDIVVYRGTSGNRELTDCALLSTSLDKDKAKEFIKARDKDGNQKGTLYKIIIPKGSPVIAYTTELISGKIGNHPIRDDQREVLIDSNLYDFECIDSIEEYDYRNPISHKTYIARPKVFDLEEAKQK